MWFFNCLDKDLGDEVLKANPGTPPQNMTEQNLIACTKKLAVKVESKLIHRIKMGQAVQPPGTGVNNFLANLKGLARQCDFTVTCSGCEAKTDYSEEVIGDQLVRGLDDQDILADLLGDDKIDRTLKEMVEFIARKEQAKLERGSVSCETPSTSAVRVAKTPTTSSSRPTTCRHCKGGSHGPDDMKTRKSSCPAWDNVCEKCQVKGHYSQACYKCPDCGSWGHKSKNSKWCLKGERKQKSDSETASMLAAISTTFIGQEIGVLNSVADLRMASIGSDKRGRRIPLEHHIFENEAWIRRKCAPQPTCLLTVKPCSKDHEDFGHSVINKGALHPVVEHVVADTACQSIAIPPSFAYSAGFKRRDFLPVKSNMNGAGGSHLGVLGAVVMEFASSDGHNNILSTRQLCYVCEKVSRVYLSRQGCIALGMVDSDFPSPKHKENHEVAVTEGDHCPCPCPARSTIPPPLPTAVPADIHVGDDQAPALLKQWLLDHYASSVFNVCEHQKLPMMTGTPLQLHVDPAAKPVACHRVTPVPLHWKYKVKADIDRDVALGVLEKVPDNNPPGSRILGICQCH